MTTHNHRPLKWTHKAERDLVLSELEQPAHIDERFKNLLGDDAWNLLPGAIRRRFGRHMEDGKSIVYKGVITRMEMSKAGWFLAQACRLIGAPLPFEGQANGTPAIVTVTEDKQANGQFWTRTYGRKTGFPHVIHSSKRFEGKTGLEEYIGCGIRMDLKASASKKALVFSSAGYSIDCFGLRVRLPNALEPGQVTVTHEDQGNGYFAFILEVDHPIFGKLIHQRGIFCEHEVVVV